MESATKPRKHRLPHVAGRVHKPRRLEIGIHDDLAGRSEAVFAGWGRAEGARIRRQPPFITGCQTNNHAFSWIDADDLTKKLIAVINLVTVIAAAPGSSPALITAASRRRATRSSGGGPSPRKPRLGMSLSSRA